ncbi:hypothetical protein [Ligilactobacillus faecis]|uniref:hypothetical protein n=1 Tax=Ligilactobacillus faecis TaxID=762833 RepID=UPI0024682427|nr:hypothetical protein [Ligilactobacillus faecis]WGN89018.1 hypothetical protein QFX10_08160 [Ligilactobacillus faecis]
MRSKLEEKDILRDKYGHPLRECDELRQGNTKYEVEIIRPGFAVLLNKDNQSEMMVTPKEAENFELVRKFKIRQKKGWRRK